MGGSRLRLLLAVVAGVALVFVLKGRPDEPGRSGRPDAPRPTPAGRPPDDRPAVDAPAEPDEPAAAPFDPATDVHGVVVDAEGRPIAGAAVASRLAPPAARVLPDLVADGAAGPGTRTRPDGTFALRWFRGRRGAVTVAKPGFATATVPFARPGERLVIVLRAPRTLTVRAHDASGRPVPGATVILHAAREDGLDSVHREATTDERGVVAFANVGAGNRGVVRCVRAGYAPALQPVSIPAEDVAVQVPLHAARTISGRVVDAETSLPIAGAHVRSAHAGQPSATTDGDGRYRFAWWPDPVPGRSAELRQLQAAAAGNAAARAAVDARTSVDFALRRLRPVRGRVVDPRGAPVAAADVVVSAFAWKERGGVWNTSRVRARTDRSGAFEVHGLSPGQRHTAIVLADGFGRIAVDFGAGLDATGYDLGDVALAASHAIRGLVQDRSGNPGRRLRVLLHGAARPASGAIERQFTDERGRFEFTDLPPGTFLVDVRVPGGPTIRKRVEIATGTTITTTVVQLREGSAGQLVVDEDPRTAVTGHVTVVEGGRVQISAGRADGVKRGMRLQVFRDGEAIGTLQIVDVLNDAAIGLPRGPGAIQVGDTVEEE